MSKIDFSLLNRLVAESNTSLELALKQKELGVKGSSHASNDYVVELSKVYGLVAAIYAESSALIGDLAIEIKNSSGGQPVSTDLDPLSSLFGPVKSAKN
jgi:archaellin